MGKSTIAEALSESNILDNYVCIDSDKVDINWWDYAGKFQFYIDNTNKTVDETVEEIVKFIKSIE